MFKFTETKEVTQKKHAVKRLKQRFSLNELDYPAIVDMIKTNNENATFVERESNRRTVWKVIYKGRIMKAIYDKVRHNIITFMAWKD